MSVAISKPVVIVPGRQLYDHATLGQTDACLKLLQSDKSLINWADGDGWTPLIISIYVGHESTAISLLNSGADPQLCTRDNWSPIFLSAFYSRTLVLKSLLKMGVDVNVKTRGGWTPLMIASSLDKIDVAEALLAAGAEVNHVAKVDGASALSLAAKYGFESMSKLLISKGAKVELAVKDKAGKVVPEVKSFLEGI